MNGRKWGECSAKQGLSPESARQLMLNAQDLAPKLWPLASACCGKVLSSGTRQYRWLKSCEKTVDRKVHEKSSGRAPYENAAYSIGV